MAEHKIIQNNIMYIIPTDELLQKLKKNEAFIDDYGRLMNRKPHRVLKELKHYAANDLEMQGKPNRPITPAKNSNSVMEYIKVSVRNKMVEESRHFIDKAVDRLFYEILPGVWEERIIPTYHKTKEALNTKELKVNAIPQQEKLSEVIVTNPEKPHLKMTKEEADAEKRKVLYHWIGLLNSLTKLQEAGELDTASTLEQLTDPATIKRVNGFLSENPNLLETDKYILLHGLLGRNLYKEGQLLPIQATEIEMLINQKIATR